MRRNAMHLTTAPSNRVGSVHKANEAVASGDATSFRSPANGEKNEARTFDAEDQRGRHGATVQVREKTLPRSRWLASNACF